MTPIPRLVRICAVAAPVLLLLYGLLRFSDNSDGRRGSGLAWNLGHTLFFVAFVLLAILAVGLRQLLVSSAAPIKSIIASLAAGVAVLGAACFLWVILGDLFERFAAAAPLPDQLMTAGPLLFQLGTLTLLTQLAITQPRRLPLWCPLLVLLGFVAIAANDNLLPVAAVLLIAGLAPIALARRSAIPTVS
jgi:protein-S-isoprenylcysteine O-methyltransferase Ste14